jgi:hypothetical protein
MKMNLTFSYTTQFAKDGPGRGRGLFWGIDQMRSEVRGLVNTFRPRFG